MPTRDQRSPLDCTYVYTDAVGSKTTNPYKGLLVNGTYQFIDNLNNAGGFVPGIFRINPVVIKKSIGSSTTGSYLASNAGYGYPKQSWSATGCWIAAPLATRYPGWSMPFGTWNANLANYSKNKAFGKFNRGEAEVGIMLGELGETLRMIRHPFKELTDLLSTIRNPTKRNLLAGPDYLANQFLMIKFGVMPLIEDIEKIRKAYDRMAEGLINHLLRKKGQVVTLSSIKDTWDYVDTVSVTLTYETKTEQKSCSVVYYQMVLEDIARRRAKMFGYDLSQVPSTMYQLVSYSFVVDWFLDFGNWIRAISPASHISYRGGCTSQVTTKTCTVSGINARITDPNRRTKESYVGSVPTISWVSEILERRLDTSTPALPAINPNSLDLGKWISLVAMMWQRTPSHWRNR